MTSKQPTLRDLLTIRDYLRERVDQLLEEARSRDARAVASEVVRLSNLIAKAEAEVEA